MFLVIIMEPVVKKLDFMALVLSPWLELVVVIITGFYDLWLFFSFQFIYLFKRLFLVVIFCDVFGSFFLQFNRIHQMAGLGKIRLGRFIFLLTIGLVPCFSELWFW